MGEEHGEGAQAVHHQAHGLRLHAHARELHHVWQPAAAGERGRGARPLPRTPAAQADLQTRYVPTPASGWDGHGCVM